MNDLHVKITAELDRRAAQIEGLVGISAVAALWLRVVAWGRDVLERHPENQRFVRRRTGALSHSVDISTPGFDLRPDDQPMCERCDWISHPCPEIRALATALGITP